MVCSIWSSIDESDVDFMVFFNYSPIVIQAPISQHGPWWKGDFSGFPRLHTKVALEGLIYIYKGKTEEMMKRSR